MIIRLEDYNLHAKVDPDHHQDNKLRICFYDTFLDGYTTWDLVPKGNDKYRPDYPKPKNLKLTRNSIVSYEGLEFVVVPEIKVIDEHTIWKTTHHHFVLEVL